VTRCVAHLLERSGADEDHGAAHPDRAPDSPREDAGLLGLGDFEIVEQEDEDEEVVDGEGLLDEVAGEELHGGSGAFEGDQS